MSQILQSRRALPVVMVIGTIFCSGMPATAQNNTCMGTTDSYAIGQSSTAGGVINGSVPSGPATNEVLHLTLRDAINQALRYNLGTIDSGENTRIARGQRLLALSELLPQVSAGVSENVEQLSLSSFGFEKVRGISLPSVIGPFSYGGVDANLS